MDEQIYHFMEVSFGAHTIAPLQTRAQQFAPHQMREVLI